VAGVDERLDDIDKETLGEGVFEVVGDTDDESESEALVDLLTVAAGVAEPDIDLLIDGEGDMNGGGTSATIILESNVQSSPPGQTFVNRRSDKRYQSKSQLLP